MNEVQLVQNEDAIRWAGRTWVPVEVYDTVVKTNRELRDEVQMLAARLRDRYVEEQ